MALWQLALMIEVQGPILTQGSGARHYGIDTSVLRDHFGQIVLPGSLLKGNVRHALQELIELLPSSTVQSDWLARWLGAEGVNLADNRFRGKLNFDFYWYVQSSDAHNQQLTSESVQDSDVKSQLNTINRIRIDEQGTVEPGALQFIETPYAPGESIRFCGNIHFRASPPQAKQVVNYLAKALDYCEALGGLKSIGFGQLVNHHIQLRSLPAKKSNPLTNQKAMRIGFTAQLDRPLCIAHHVGKGNAFHSQSMINGAAIKGCIAAQLNPQTQPLLYQYLDRIVVGHALLGAQQNPQRRLQPNALTLAIRTHDNGDEQWVDVIDEPWLGGIADRFSADFKTTDNATLPAAITPGYSLLVRTAIECVPSNPAHRGTAKDQQLFSYQCINHRYKNDNSEVTATRWRGYFDLSLLAQLDKKTLKQLRTELGQVITSPLLGLGKTKAIVRLSDFDEMANTLPFKRLVDGSRIKLVLNTPTALLSPLALTPICPLLSQYQAVFDQRAPGVFTLACCYTSERITGGEYWWHKFTPAQPYQPYIESKAGSCFVLVVNSGMAVAAMAILTQWQTSGLVSCIPAHISKPRWQVDPYDHANGFGEVRLTLIKER